MFAGGVGASVYHSNDDGQASYNIKCKSEIKAEKVERTLLAVRGILNSIGWDSMDLRIAYRRFMDPDDLKVVAKDKGTKAIVGYAILVPDDDNTWYVSQIAVEKSLQGRGIGKAVMTKVFEEALARNIGLVYLTTDGSSEKLSKFYSSFASDTVTVKYFDMGRDRFGNLKQQFSYTFD